MTIVKELAETQPERLSEEQVAALAELSMEPERMVARHSLRLTERTQRIEIQGGHRWLLWDGEYVRQDVVEGLVRERCPSCGMERDEGWLRRTFCPDPYHETQTEVEVDDSNDPEAT